MCCPDLQQGDNHDEPTCRLDCSLLDTVYRFRQKELWIRFESYCDRGSQITNIVPCS